MSHPLMAGAVALRRDRLRAGAQGRVLDFDRRAQADPSLDPASFDTIVVVHTLCGIDDVDAAIQRVNELLAPGGRVLLLEHVRATGVRGRIQDVAAPMWRRAPAGCHVNRDPIAALRRNGFAVVDCDRFRLSRTLPMVAPHISAVAIRKAKAPVKDPAVEEVVE